MNVNLDMVGRNEAGELYVAGTYHYPQLLPMVTEVQAVAPLKLLVGHDRPDLPPGDDWNGSSDHGPFHNAGIPFLYFGVEDHPDYHRATDDWDKIEYESQRAILEVVVKTTRALADLAEKPEYVRNTTGGMGGNRPRGPYLGIQIDQMDTGKGALITAVMPNTAASESGLLADDRIVKFGGRDLPNAGALLGAIRAAKVGEVIGMVVIRDGKEVALKAKLKNR